jgi:hypothetical protein
MHPRANKSVFPSYISSDLGLQAGVPADFDYERPHSSFRLENLKGQFLVYQSKIDIFLRE